MARSAVATEVESSPAASSGGRAPRAAGHLRIVSRELAGADVAQPADAQAPPDPHPLAARLAQVIAEVVSGARSASQLSGVATLQVLRQLERGRGRFGAATGGHPPRPIVRSVHVSRIAGDSAEVCAVIITGPRVRALALRLDAVNGQWRCTAVQLG